MPLPTLDDSFGHTRDELRRIATHVLARALRAETGRIGLRPTPGGFGTPEFGSDRRRLRVADGLLVAESGGSPSNRTVPIDGASLADLAELVGVHLTDDEHSVGHDTPPLGDVRATIHVDAVAARALAAWYDLSARALDRAVATMTTAAQPTRAQLWPEHFDVGLDVAFDPSAPTERRANLGGSPGDDGAPPPSNHPYLYVGPWTDDRPGDPSWWNAPFGATLAYPELAAADDPIEVGATFFRDGFERLTTPG